MTKRETFSLLALINVYYEQFEINQKKIDSWHSVLKHYTYEKLEANLLAHVEKHPYPPKLSELTQKQTSTSQVIPTLQETTFILHTCEKPAKESVIQEELRKMREILGIDRR